MCICGKLTSNSGSGRPKTYIKGPDVWSKSRRTFYRYRHLLVGQTRLDEHGFITPDNSLDNREKLESSKRRVEEIDEPESESTESTGSTRLTRSSGEEECVNSESPVQVAETLEESESISADETSGDDMDYGPDSWEDEIDEGLMPQASGSRSWLELREQIKDDLKKHHKILTLSQINQLMILRNFANLRIKGWARISASLEIALTWHEGKGGPSVHFARCIRALARHYQMYEQLPRERRGGAKTSGMHSLLHDENVRTAVQAWLVAQPIGSVTPAKLRHALQDAILPALNLTLTKPPCERTARRWLIKLGWRKTQIRKGVYMDGHEHPDVVKYRDNIFLPRMEQLEWRMAKYIPDHEGNMSRIEPDLQPGEREIIAEFQDETCCQANEHVSSAWCAIQTITIFLYISFVLVRLKEGQQILRKKGRGRLIHNSDFIEEVNGRLVIRNDDGTIHRSARKIIFPGSNGDPYWDCLQLIDQVKNLAIPVFEEAHPGGQALFIFDQSSAHACLPPDSLKAFEMNKSNGGKQRVQKDTIIPMSNLYPEFRGKVQQMTTEDGKPKGLKQTLEEQGFNVSNLKAKCSPVCPFESERCCMARLMSQQEDFTNQESMLEKIIHDAGHECIFLPKFHCELNPIEMVRVVNHNTFLYLSYVYL